MPSSLVSYSPSSKMMFFIPGNDGKMFFNIQLIKLLSLLIILVIVLDTASGIKCNHCSGTDTDTSTAATDCANSNLKGGDARIVECPSGYCKFYQQDYNQIELSCGTSKELGDCLKQATAVYGSSKTEFTYACVTFDPDHRWYDQMVMENFSKCVEAKGLTSKNQFELQNQIKDGFLVCICDGGDFCTSTQNLTGAITKVTEPSPPPTAKGIKCYECEGKKCDRVTMLTKIVDCPTGYCKIRHPDDSIVFPAVGTRRGCGKNSEGECAKKFGDGQGCTGKNTREKFFSCKSSRAKLYGPIADEMDKKLAGLGRSRGSGEKLGKWCVCDTELCNGDPVGGSAPIRISEIWKFVCISAIAFINLSQKLFFR